MRHGDYRDHRVAAKDICAPRCRPPLFYFRIFDLFARIAESTGKGHHRHAPHHKGASWPWAPWAGPGRHSPITSLSYNALAGHSAADRTPAYGPYRDGQRAAGSFVCVDKTRREMKQRGDATESPFVPKVVRVIVSSARPACVHPSRPDASSRSASRGAYVNRVALLLNERARTHTNTHSQQRTDGRHK